MSAIFIVFGKEVNQGMTNVKSLATKIIPNIGETILFNGEWRKVNNKAISYKHVEDYELKQDGRGGEMIYIFV